MSNFQTQEEILQQQINNLPHLKSNKRHRNQTQIPLPRPRIIPRRFFLHNLSIPQHPPNLRILGEEVFEVCYSPQRADFAE